MLVTRLEIYAAFVIVNIAVIATGEDMQSNDTSKSSLTRTRSPLRWAWSHRVSVVIALLAVAFVVGAEAQRVDDANMRYRGVPLQVRPGTDAWKTLRSHDEMVAAVNLPQERVAQMNTVALVEAAIDYPLFGDMFAYNSPQMGFEAVAARSNVLTELLNRSDSGSKLVARYERINIADVDILATDLARGKFDFEVTTVETLLAQPKIQATLLERDRSRLMAEALRKVTDKAERPAIFGNFGIERSTLIIGRLMAGAIRDPAAKTFVREGGAASDAVLESIIYLDATNAKHQLRVKTNDYWTTIYTPNGTEVSSAIQMTDELTAAQIATRNSYVGTTYPLATRETDASRKYNCHSYAWYNQSTSNSIWLNTPGDDVYWNDGSYVLIQTANGGLPIPSSIPNGAKVSYGLSDHSAVKATSTQYRSKWGEYPRMLHTPGYCPYACTNCSFLVSYYRFH